MAEMTNSTAGGLLQYYSKHGIAPVQYRMDNVRAHLDRRDSLYRALGLPPVAFRGARVLEVAPGTGQNSLYVASCLPETLDLVEPNPACLAAIKTTYENFTLRHTPPRVHATRLEDFEPAEKFDIVLCENWLGNLPAELLLIGKLASLVAPGGVLVLTMVPYSGFLPNVMRKLLALRLVPPSLDFEAKTQMLVQAFRPHLSTMASMTRSHRDWVHDCLINPHYFNVALPLQSVLSAIDPGMEALATFPRFTHDWRWFKALTRVTRQSNDNLVQALRRNVHNFMDYRHIWPERTVAENAALDDVCRELHGAALAWQAAFEAATVEPLSQCSAKIAGLLRRLAATLSDIDLDLNAAIDELIAVWDAPEITVSAIQGMRAFGALFGREAVYLSLARPIET